MGVSDEQPLRDDGIAVHYSTVAPGTSIYASDGVVVGKVVRVLDNAREHILDGFVFEDPQGATKFVDAPEVQRTFERAVDQHRLSRRLQARTAESTGVTESVKNSKLGRLFGR